MIIDKSGGKIYKTSIFIIAAIAIFWFYLQPDAWFWALSFGFGVSLLVIFVFNAGRREGIAYADLIASINTDSKTTAGEVHTASAKLDEFQSAMAEVDLFSYELANNLVPDGYSENNPGLGPMNFNEWREWKQSEFERTGNIWSKHPDGKPPNEN